MKVASFELGDSKTWPGHKFLIAITEDGQRFVVAGDQFSPSLLIPFEQSFDAVGREAVLENMAKAGRDIKHVADPLYFTGKEE